MRISDRLAVLLAFAALAQPPASLGAQAPASLRAAAPTVSARIVTHDNRTAAGVLRDGVLDLRLEARSGIWYPEAEDGPGIEVQAFGEVGGPLQIPAPLVRVPEGTELRVNLHNHLSDPLVVYGLHARPGSPEDTLMVAVDATREVRFRAGAPGTYFYWGATSGEPMEERGGVDSQLSGAFIIDPADASVADRIFVMGLWVEWDDGASARRVMTINGKGWPHTERFGFTVKETVQWRWLNPTRSSHPMHLHGFYFRVDSRGTWAADTVYAEPDRRLAVTELMLPGATNSFMWIPERQGNWLFHCHFPFHMSSGVSLSHSADDNGHSGAEHGDHVMAGLVLGIHVNAHQDHPPVAEDGREPRRLRLLVQSRPDHYGDASGLGYVLHEGGPEPAPDSISIPGSTLVLRRGEPVAITVVNRLAEPTTVHWHGMELKSFPDGVPGWSGMPGRTLPAIAPADSFVARFTPPRAGTFIYHSHLNELAQIGSGLYGAMVVVEPDRDYDPSIDHLIVVGQAGPEEDSPGLVNGSFEPPPIDLRAGETHRLRLINITNDWRVMFSLVSDAGFAEWRPVAKDGADLPAGQATLRPAHLLTGAGETADFEISFPTPGVWRLEVKTQLSGWHIPITVRVRQ